MIDAARMILIEKNETGIYGTPNRRARVTQLRGLERTAQETQKIRCQNPFTTRDSPKTIDRMSRDTTEIISIEGNQVAKKTPGASTLADGLSVGCFPELLRILRASRSNYFVSLALLTFKPAVGFVVADKGFRLRVPL